MIFSRVLQTPPSRWNNVNVPLGVQNKDNIFTHSFASLTLSVKILSLFFTPRGTLLQCFGSIEFLLPSEELRMVTSEQLVSRNNRILRINSEFTAARVNGNCCWELYPRYRFRGSKITMGPSEEKRLDFNPKSLKVKNCWIKIFVACRL